MLGGWSGELDEWIGGGSEWSGEASGWSGVASGFAAMAIPFAVGHSLGRASAGRTMASDSNVAVPGSIIARTGFAAGGGRSDTTGGTRGASRARAGSPPPGPTR